MKQWIIDLGSFTVEVETFEDAYKASIAKLHAGEAPIEIVNVEEDIA